MSVPTGKRAKRRAQGTRDRLGHASPAAPAQSPTSAHDLFAAAAQHHQSGRLAEAEPLYRQVLALDPNRSECLHNLGVLAHQMGRNGEAADLIGQAIALNDRRPNSHCSLGNALRSQGELHAAAASYRRAIDLKPDFADAHNNLGTVLKAQGELHAALASHQRAIDLKPNFAEARNNLGAVLEAQGELHAAATSYQRAIDLKPDFAEAYNHLGSVLVRQGRVEEGAACLRRAAALESSRAKTWYNLGRALEILGELGPAQAALARAAELDPHAEEAIFSLARLQPMNDGSPAAETVFALVSRLADDLDQLALDERPAAMFAMAKALEDRREFDRAFAFMAQANALVRATLSFDIADDEGRMNTIAKTFNGPVLERLKDVGLASQRPVFIVGMPRSGTTLIEQIISAHPEVYGAGELHNLSKAIAASGSKASGAQTGVDWRAIAQTYLDSLPQAASGQKQVTDKNVSNFEHLGLIHLCLPNARIIHCRRDPRDVCLSCFAARFRHGHNYAFNLVELGRAWRAYDRLMAHWRAVLPPGRMLEVQYEEVVDDVEAWARRLIAHCGLDWDSACLRFYESGRKVHTGSLAQVRRPIYETSVGRWRPFARHLGPLLETLGGPWSNEGYTLPLPGRAGG